MALTCHLKGLVTEYFAYFISKIISIGRHIGNYGNVETCVELE